MNLTPLAVILGFVLLWLAPLWWIGGHPNPKAPRRFAWVVIAYTLAFTGLGFWWHVPLGTQRVMESSAVSWASGVDISMRCEDLQAVLPRVKQMGRGLIAVSEDGEITVASHAWSQLPAGQRAMLETLATQARSCLGDPNDMAPVLIRDPVTEQVLGEGRRGSLRAAADGADRL